MCVTVHVSVHMCVHKCMKFYMYARECVSMQAHACVSAHTCVRLSGRLLSHEWVGGGSPGCGEKRFPNHHVPPPPAVVPADPSGALPQFSAMCFV